ncbi:MAG: DNA-protecting protein DprA [Hydrogenophilales bacterium CG03_land_8_20_14_0_80_62_28]|nr:DNA-protecting protein DprA [Betaproteobacteria bacterium]OIO78622.1 MAG: DNA protecting protein DprA [Hydrogenophilaceae bacterium CG1_02_62_390]PIV22698.1 MAG: DNA-protecting protein DprA [Hydrogenophilales bacterium CG03_land_8_20_14_0_80_62_28]PIW39076.1 MAG: DNA-protecting protein DprA [Hydrogenophilales bacterium CG15_BIG_FIL_POST_REV_8_21_14_020_62_31]PIW72794.1 MAG: DNA-protecting protein DprA [Hydrogenophilales bacterium CG12_big_fil_rev_8_21_14_0_65_61_21]PIX01387.1 MAG: DNA-prote
MTEPADALYWLALEAIPGLGPDTARRLLARFPTPADIFAAPVGLLKPIVGDQIAAALSTPVRPDDHQETLDWLAAPDAHLITWNDPDYPETLRNMPDAPAWLYVKGQRAVLRRPMLAIVGSRTATAQGKRDAQAFAQALAEAGLTIVSGLADGIDAAAHEGGLAGNGAGVAVVGTGLDRVYPAKNRDLAHRLAASGALVSEFALGTPPRPGHFPRRNRLISGLSLGVLVVEAAPQSGSLITARLAAEQGRDVFAIPGSIHSPLAKGCHYLIKQGAKLVESAADILEELNLPWAIELAARETPPTAAADPLLEQMGVDPISLDELAARSRLTVESLSAMLFTHEMAGLVALLPGGLYQRLY